MTILRSGIMTAAALTIHNVPEGMATFSSTMHDVNLGLLIAFAIILHNIPEGVSAAMPILCATNDRKKAFTWSFLSGLAEPAGALACALVLLPFLSRKSSPACSRSSPASWSTSRSTRYCRRRTSTATGHLVIVASVIGMAIMSISLMKF